MARFHILRQLRGTAWHPTHIAPDLEGARVALAYVTSRAQHGRGATRRAHVEIRTIAAPDIATAAARAIAGHGDTVD